MTEDIRISSQFELFSKESEVIKAKGSVPNPTDIDNLPRVWINTAKEGQIIDVNGEICSMTREGLESSVGSWKDGKILDNHKTQRSGFKIYDDKFESPFLAFLLDEETAKSLEDAEGGSIDGIALKVKDKKILKLRGVGYSILQKGITPSCTREAGCSLPIAGEGVVEKEDGRVNIEGDIVDPNIKLEGDKVAGGGNSPRDLNKNKEEMEKQMADKEEKEVTFSEAQVATIKAEAAKELTDHMTDSHKVAITDLEKLHATEIKTLKEAHVADLETQRVNVTKHVETVESLATKFALSDEAKKTMSAAKTPEEIYAFLETLKVTKAEPVIAAKGAAEGSGCGVILGSEVKAKAPETVKTEEIGTYDPVTKKYIPSFREVGI